MKRKPAAVLLVLPLLVFALLRLFPTLDTFAWSASWYTRLFQFYVGSLTSLLALIAALFAGTTLGAKTSARALFVTLAFIAISALLLVSSLATPTVLVADSSNRVLIWSLNFSFPTGALLFALASVRWRPAIEARLVARRHLLWVASIILFTLYVAIAFLYPPALETLDRFRDGIQYVLAVVTLILLFIAVRRRHIITWHQGSRIENSLTITFILLAEAQIIVALGVPGRLSWLLYHPPTLAALFVALGAMLATLETSRELKLTHYFAAVGSLTIFGISLVIGEAGTHWLALGTGRSSVVPLALLQGVLSFLVLFLIVWRLNRLITERTLALKREQHLRSELIQLIVHDLKSPLSVIKGGINLLAKARLGPLTETQTRLLTNLEQSGDDILQMINDLLDVERMEVGALKLHLGMVEPESLLKECVNDLQIVASTYKQNLTISHATVLPRIQVDKNLLRRVLNNLLTNALKFTPERGDIQVTAAVEGEYLVIGVADSGAGVPPADRERIFEKFGQVEGTERRGAGLGLTFCKMAIDAHRGTISVGESASGGALFTIRLPLRQVAAEAVYPAEAGFEEQDVEVGNLAGELYPGNEGGR